MEPRSLVSHEFSCYVSPPTDYITQDCCELMIQPIDFSGAAAVSEPGFRRAAAVGFYVESFMPFSGKEPFPPAAQQASIPIVLMQLRYDGKIGFPGGIVEEGERAEEALLRELEEEMGVSEQTLGYTFAGRFEPTCAYEVSIPTGFFKGKLRSYFYSCAITAEEMRAVERCGLSAEHFGSEVWGILRVNCGQSPPLPEYLGSSLGNFLKHEFLPSSDWQLFDLLIKRGLVSSHAVRGLYAAANKALPPQLQPEQSKL